MEKTKPMSEVTSLLMQAIGKLIDMAPDDLHVVVILGDHESDEFHTIQNCCDECAADLVKVAYLLNEGVMPPSEEIIIDRGTEH